MERRELCGGTTRGPSLEPMLRSAVDLPTGGTNSPTEISGV